MAESWANKYRPETISDYIGDSIKEPIMSRFSTGREEDKPKVILLRGTRGCGKTSMANLIAKEFNCINKQNNLACGVCEICQDMNRTLIHAEAGTETEGATLVDIASERGVGYLDSLLEEALLEPMHPYKYKVYIFDEFHMASDTAQNRLLKIFEDVPPHLVFILCTTDPEKIKPTILSRCQMNLEVKKPTEEQMIKRLLYICEQEKVKVSQEALKSIVKRKDRIPRECILLLEEVAKGFGFTVNVENLKKHFSEVSSEVYQRYFSAANTSLDEILLFTYFLKEKGIEYKDFMKGILRFVLDAAYIQRGIGLSEHPSEYVKQTQAIFKNYTAEEMELLFEIIEQAVKSNLSETTRAEFLVVTTAMKLGRAIQAFRDLKNIKQETKEENEKAYNEYRLLQEKEKEKSIKELQSKSLQGVYGVNALDKTQLKEMKSQIPIRAAAPIKKSLIPLDVKFDESNEPAESSTEDVLTPEDLIKMFGK